MTPITIAMAMNVLRYIKLRPEHRPTGKTRHTIAGRDIAPVAALRVQRDGDAGYFLIYLDADGNELADTWHQTLDAAMAQAKREFDVRPDEWPSD